MLVKFYVKAKTKVDNCLGYVKNQRGAQALEWIALGMLVLAIMAAIATVFDSDKSVGKAVAKKLKDLIESIGS